MKEANVLNFVVGFVFGLFMGMVLMKLIQPRYPQTPAEAHTIYLQLMADERERHQQAMGVADPYK